MLARALGLAPSISIRSAECIRRLRSRFVSRSILLSLFLVAFFLRPVRADIFRWDNSQLVPGTTGTNLIPGVDLSNWNTGGHQLEYANFAANLSYANFYGSDLNNALFPSATATLTGANFTNATILGTNFSGMTSHGFTSAQLYSTATYVA